MRVTTYEIEKRHLRHPTTRVDAAPPWSFDCSNPWPTISVLGFDLAPWQAGLKSVTPQLKLAGDLRSMFGPPFPLIRAS